MGLKLSLFRRPAEVEAKQSEDINNKVSSSEPTPISADIVEKVDPKCPCQDCKCDPCNCTKKDISHPKPTEDTQSVERRTETPQENTSHETQEQEVVPQLSQPNEPTKSAEESASTIEEKPSNESEQGDLGEQQNEERPHDCCQGESQTEPQSETQEKKCRCDPCTCNPCKCGQHSEVTPNGEKNEPQSQESEHTEVQPPVQESEPVNQAKGEPEKPNQGKHENESTGPTNDENVVEAPEPINEKVEAPQEPSLEVQTNG